MSNTNLVRKIKLYESIGDNLPGIEQNIINNWKTFSSQLHYLVTQNGNIYLYDTINEEVFMEVNNREDLTYWRLTPFCKMFGKYAIDIAAKDAQNLLTYLIKETFNITTNENMVFIKIEFASKYELESFQKEFPMESYYGFLKGREWGITI